ncbi:MAG: tRNA (adenosine(37)-N6)-threonylcarbamoyltransferase complex ATPase subunit type 1 TsaE [Acidobacteriota bacterium]|nr:tRNA (adenosine(37)-N6)-threonylcarbamoyltransferase complex ATPase subunit type 1 TsaE [Acidobacteriota bacterium]MDQ5837859.1 tRNA (adenosine(37)-N6)-threonylcarbamoyltransferase complex ATPase subunit type 1 TsaE [Acidobacteriota bacterium]
MNAAAPDDPKQTGEDANATPTRDDASPPTSDNALIQTDEKATIRTGEWTSLGPEETFEAGRRVGERLKGGEILLLGGALGAGKTVFTKGLAAGLGLDPAEVSSPSFTLVNRHAEGRLLLYHIDLYRLAEGATSAHAVDLDELLADERAVIVIEWAERMGRYPLPPPVWRVLIEGDGEEPRRISIKRAV